MYDFQFNMTFKAHELGSYVAVIFRKRDDFNFYAIEIGKEFIRFKAMVNAKPIIVKTQ